MKEIYCPKCQKVVPMLEDHEFEFYASAHRKVLESIKEYREKHNVSLKEAPLEKLREPALRTYEQLTGYKPAHTEFDHIWHHQAQKYEKSTKEPLNKR